MLTYKNRRKLLTTFVCLTVTVLLLLVTDSRLKRVVDKFKISDSFMADLSIYLMKSSDAQVQYQQEDTCRIPKLLTDDPSLRHLLRHHYPMVCSQMKNWIYTKDGKFFIDSAVVDKYGDVKCDYHHIKRISENDEEIIKYENFQNGSWVLGDGFRVKCKSKSEYKYRNVHFTVPDLSVSGRLQPIEKPVESLLADLHIFFYIMDSMSRINTIRKLPKFYKMLTEEMDALDMQSFNIVGDGTPWAIIPLTTGHFQYELPEARKRFDNASFLDDWPFIFKDYREAGYGTVFAEEQPQFNAFTYKLKGFNVTPVDHYLRPVLSVANAERSYQRPYCLGDTPKSIMWLNYWKELKLMYEKYNRRTLAILFPGETSHDDYNLVQTLDEHLEREFRNLHNQNAFNNTLLFVMGDHGRRFGPVRQTQSGKLEEKLPFLTVIVPPWFRHSFPAQYANLLTNRNRLLTVFDLHATLEHILTFDGKVVEETDNSAKIGRSLSLFNEIPANRSCQDAAIKPHFCACLEWSPVRQPAGDRNVINALMQVLEEINKKLQITNGACLPLKLEKIISANTYRPSENLLAFKESTDYDNYVQDMTSDSTATFVYYQIRFVSSPANADWEITITHYLDLQTFKFVEDDLSRLNAYGDQPKCIIDVYPHLRSYCYCSSKNDTSSSV